MRHAPCALRVRRGAAAKVPRIGFLLTASSYARFARLEAFRQGLRELGYVEGKSIVIDWRSADGNAERSSEHAAELVSLKPDVIITAGANTTRAAKAATTTIPIVMAQDPAANGFVASLAQPGWTSLDCPGLLPRSAANNWSF